MAIVVVVVNLRRVGIFISQCSGLLSSCTSLHYAKSYRPFELFINENYKL